MPYVITTKSPQALAHGRIHAETQSKIAAREAERYSSRRAVATLDEAHFRVTQGGANIGQDDPGFAEFQALVRQLVTEQGGTVGPLPDGTVIEVSRVEWGDLREFSTEDTPTEDDAIIRAYNAAQG